MLTIPLVFSMKLEVRLMNKAGIPLKSILRYQIDAFGVKTINYSSQN